MSDKIQNYRSGQTPLPDHNVIWPLYGAGFDNLGQEGKPIETAIPAYGPDELLVRHDACGLCFSDIKVIKLGEEHPRIYRKMLENPVVLGHEVSMTVVGVGEHLRDQYKPGDRFIIQADIYVDGVGYAYGYEIQGGLSHYGLIDRRVLEGDEGNYLLPIKPTTGYAESALTEPWACVIAAYGLEYRTGLKAGGTTWIIGTGDSDTRPYTISGGMSASSHPVRLLLTNVPSGFAKQLKQQAQQVGVEVVDVPDVSQPPAELVDDIVLLGADADLLEKASPRLANGGIFAIVTDKPFSRRIQVDMGRIHYNRWVYVGTSSTDIAKAYSDVPVRSGLKAGGSAWFVGAAGPMGRMHVQRAIQIADGPKTIICTDVSDHRLDDLKNSFLAEAEAKGLNYICINPIKDPQAYAELMNPYLENGFDDIVVLAPVPALITDSARYLGREGVMNVFAGVARGTMVEMELSDTVFKQTRWIGQSGSTIQDLRTMLEQEEAGILSTNRAVAAIGSLNATRDGLKALQDAVYPGKVVIFPHIKDFPLTALSELKDKLPSVYEKLDHGQWSAEAEAEFLRLMLP